MDPFFLVMIFPVGSSPIEGPNGGAAQVQLATIVRGAGIPNATVAALLRDLANQLDPPATLAVVPRLVS